MLAEEKEHRARLSNMSDGLLRQRRNLILISVFHLLFNFADVEFEKVGLLGTDLLVGNPAALLWFAWALWAYFLFRYWLYYRTERLPQPIEKQIDELHIKGLEQWAVRCPLPPLKKSISFDDWPHRYYEVSRKYKGRLALELVESTPDRPSNIVSSTAIPKRRLFFEYCRAFMSVSSSTTEVTDYWLPFLLALSAPFVSLFLWLSAAPPV